MPLHNCDALCSDYYVSEQDAFATSQQRGHLHKMRVALDVRSPLWVLENSAHVFASRTLVPSFTESHDGRQCAVDIVIREVLFEAGLQDGPGLGSSLLISSKRVSPSTRLLPYSESVTSAADCSVYHIAAQWLSQTCKRRSNGRVMR